MSQKLAETLAREFEEISNIQCSYEFFNKGESHEPTTLKKGQEQGVYVFLQNENICFKVGKAGPNSQARWNSHHYKLNKTKSSLSGSIKNDLEKFKSFFDSSVHNEIDNLNNNNIKYWIRNNLSRIEGLYFLYLLFKSFNSIQTLFSGSMSSYKKEDNEEIFSMSVHNINTSFKSISIKFKTFSKLLSICRILLFLFIKAKNPLLIVIS